MGTTKIIPTCLDPVANDFASAMAAFWSQGVNSALEAIKVVRYSCYYDFQRLIVIIPADLAFSHGLSFSFYCLSLQRSAGFQPAVSPTSSLPAD